jgi:hypothetical protein
MAVREPIIVALLTKSRTEPHRMQIDPHSITRCPSSLRPQLLSFPLSFRLHSRFHYQPTQFASLRISSPHSDRLEIFSSSHLFSDLFSNTPFSSPCPPSLYSSIFPSLLLSSKLIASPIVSSLPGKRLSRLAAMFSDEALASLRNRRAVRTNQNNCFSTSFVVYQS